VSSITFLKIGTITHYYEKLGVGVLKLLSGTLSVGNDIKIVDKGREILQKVESLQVEHKQVDHIKAGDDAGLKLSEKVKPGAEVFLES